MPPINSWKNVIPSLLSSLLVSNDNGADVTADMACEDNFTDFFGINESKLDVEEFDALVACAEKVLLANILPKND